MALMPDTPVCHSSAQDCWRPAHPNCTPKKKTRKSAVARPHSSALSPIAWFDPVASTLVPPHVQELLAAVARELCLPPDNGLLAPLAALEAPSFAAAPAFREPLPEGAGAQQLQALKMCLVTESNAERPSATLTQVCCMDVGL